MEKTIRVLQVLGRLDRGGAETMVMNLYRHMDRSRIQFDFVIHTTDRCDYTQEVAALGGKIYSMKPFRASTAAVYCRQWRDFFRRHPEYRIVHGHMRSTASLYFREAKRAGLVTIAHSHNTSSGRGAAAVVKNVLQYPLRWQADYLFACSERAGIWLYGRRACRQARFRIVRNGIEPDIFRFDRQSREALRRRMLTHESETAQAGAQPGAEGMSLLPAVSLVFLHIGRMEAQKNHIFLLKIMREIVKRRRDAQLWLCGTGPLERQIKEQAERDGIAEHVRFLGMRTDVPELMHAADGMIFPSLFEGLPVTLVEAQAAGLPVLMADTVTDEVILTDLVERLALSKPPERWAQEALRMAERNKGETAERRAGYADIVARSGYDVAENAKELERFYEEKS